MILLKENVIYYSLRKKIKLKKIIIIINFVYFKALKQKKLDNYFKGLLEVQSKQLSWKIDRYVQVAYFTWYPL